MTNKGYKNRQMQTEAPDTDRTQVFFFPKHNPPVAIRAESKEEAEKILEALDIKQ